MFSTLSDSDGEANQNVEHSTASTNSESLPLAISEYAKRLLSPLRFSDDEVQKKVLSFYVEDLRIFEHFGNLRAHILLGAGDFATILVEQIDAASRLSEEDESYIERRTHAALTFYGSAGPGIRSLRDQVHLNRCLRMALNLYSKDAKAHTNCLSLDAVEDEGSRKVSLWGTAVEVQYNVDYPLDLLFSQKVLAMYSKIFNLLLRILRAKRSLRSLFMTSRRNSALRRSPHARFSSDKKVGSALWDFCWQAEHFVSVFGGFQTEQVLGSTWTAFQTSWDTARTIWELKDSHVQYLNDCTHRCLLESRHKSILGVMTEGFDIVINVEKQLSITIEDCTGMGRNSGDVFFDLLKSSSVSLRRRIVFLRDALQRLFDDGPHPHLHDLLTSLGFGKESSPW
ncbi:unnamed protein product [Chondrus crispus]|uniref:Spindle pole body component n=1 Tax=Chondrus crispus TaxID=2769 RepID=R7QQR9_CHOCR|nr:unnamed protein product [Chondrus crispus]CDF40083.1 unnamed protein product [Chondrus crispus]|eukprot:XP_005710377.1 unnamed protein product [Chondrus crispus]